MSVKKINYRHRLAAIFVSFTILIVGTLSFVESMSFDYYSVLGTLKKILPSGFAMGILGWTMGMILDRPRRRRGGIHNSLFIKDVIKKDLLEEENPLEVESI